MFKTEGPQYNGGIADGIGRHSRFFILSLFECTGIYPRINRTTKPYQHRQKLFVKPKNMNIEVNIYVCLK